MGIKNRPYVGSWIEGTQTVVRYTPDAKVLINGHTELAVCATCGHKTDFNKYVTTISVDATTEPVSSCSVTMAIPRHKADVFSHDGNYVLHPGLEIVVLMRGYFPVTGYALTGQDESDDSDEGLSDKTPVYPYYQVFRGVVTEVSHEFSGGFYSASLTCSSILHFWQYLYISTNGSVFGEMPEDSSSNINLSGHKFTGMSPYGIMYSLMRVGFGACFGQNWTISQATNIAAVDQSSGTSLYKHAALWWEKRWSESSTRLRMYGFDGSLFNAFEQSYLGMFDHAATNSADFLTSFGLTLPNNYGALDTDATKAAVARSFGYRGTESTGAVMDEDGTKLDAMKMQAYTLDLGRLGAVNFFEAEYMSKMEIANAVKDIVGFEFYQDVDGDIVFKPPFYNLDTSEDEVYCIRDRDLISISESEREPEATYVKGSGSLFTNFQGILSGEFGTRQAKFADWRLIAQYGWRETSFESHYYSGSKQMFIGAIMRLDTANAEMRSAQITIPMRPELRPGYPVWVAHLDCFFYIKSLSHSYAPGSACQTTITGVAKRAKWLPPGLPDRSDGAGSMKLPTLNDIHMDAPGEYPPMPLYVFPEDIEGADNEASGPPRVMGVPNVVMALDPNKVNPTMMPGGLYFTTGDTYFDTALSLGVLRRKPGEDDVYLVAKSADPAQDWTVSRAEVITAYDDYSTAMNDPESEPPEIDAESTSFGSLLAAVKIRQSTAIPDADHLNNYMGIQRNLKNVFGSGASRGEYRYYSSSLMDSPSDQSPSTLVVDMEIGELSKTVPGGPVDAAFTGCTMLTQEGDRIKVKGGLPVRGMRVYGFSPPGAENEDEEADSTAIQHIDVTTRDIRFITFQKITTRVPHVVESLGTNALAALLLPIPAAEELFREILVLTALKQTDGVTMSAEDRFGGDTSQTELGYGLLWGALQTLGKSLGVVDGPFYGAIDGEAVGSPVNETLSKFENSFAAFGVSSSSSYEEETTAYYYPTGLLFAGSGSYVHPKGGQRADSSVIENINGTMAFNFHGTMFALTHRTVTTTGSRRTLIPIEKDVTKQVGRVDRSDPGLTGLADAAGVTRVATASATALSQQLQLIQMEWVETWSDERPDTSTRSPPDPTPAETEAYATFITAITEDFGFEVTTTGGKTTVLTTEYTESDDYSTVLPVSDNRGYEVYGTLAYGRGLTVESYKTLLEIGGSSANTQSMLAVERFFAASIAALTPKGVDVPKALGLLGAAIRAELAEGLGVTEANLQGAIEALQAGSTSESIFVRNSPVTTASRGQSIELEVSAEELASLTTVDTTICLCKGAESSHWLQAFSGEFVELHDDESVNDFLTTEADVAGYDYKIVKQALGGEMMDISTGNKLAETFATAGGMVNSLTEAATTAFGEEGEIATQWEEAITEVERNIESVTQLVEAAQEAETLEEFQELAEGRSESQGTEEEEQERLDAAEENLNQSVTPPLSYRGFDDLEDAEEYGGTGEEKED
jgi:hypothetical protein